MSNKINQTEQWKYTGFSKPESNFFKMPNDWPNITSKITSLAELKVVEYVLRHTWGYQEYDIAKRITNEEFMKGRKVQNGERIDNGTGLTKSSVIDGLRRAVLHGFLIEEIDDRDKARVKKYYKLKMKSPKEENNSGVENLYPGVENPYPSSEETIPRSEKETTERNKYVVVKRMKKFKISEEKANELAYRFSQEYIEGKIELLEWRLTNTTVGRPIKDSAAWLIKAIENDYSPPEVFRTKSERDQEKAEEQRQREEYEKEIESERRDREDRREKIIGFYKIPDELIRIWDQVVDSLQINSSYRMLCSHLEGTYLLSVQSGFASILVEDPDDIKWLSNRARSVLKNELTGYLGKAVDVRFQEVYAEE